MPPFLPLNEEYAAVQGYVLGGAQFFEPEIAPAKQEPKELLRQLINTHIAPSPLCRAAYTEKALKTAVPTGTKQYVILGAGMDTFAFREPEFFSEVPGIRGRSPSDTGGQTGTDLPRRLDDFGQSHLCPDGFHKGQLNGTADRRWF